ncbi:RadC family protein [Massilibacterium senegalense]|uniref:RadC family protein n=1 Tax=Massilibacterium senegalense TaxID=1632858 RepID=UPI000782A674
MQHFPRERLKKFGESYLTNVELVAIILRTGTKDKPVIQLAEQVLSHFESLRELRDASIEELAALKGIGEAKAIQMKAALELGFRLTESKVSEKHSIRSPQDVAKIVMDEMRFLVQEHFVTLYLNTKNQILHKKTVFIGSLNASIVHPREIVRP